MRRALMAAAATAMLAACGQGGGAKQGAAPDNLLTLTCEAFAHASAQSLTQAYGAANIVEQTLPGVEGESYVATVIYPNDQRRRLEIVWRDNATKNAPASVIVSGEDSLWVGPSNLSVGDQLADIERANGQPFQLYGFGWDYGGWVSDWKGGAFAAANGCNVRARFRSRNESNSSALGDAPFMSDDPAVRAADAAVSEFGLLFTAPDTTQSATNKPL